MSAARPPAHGVSARPPVFPLRRNTPVLSPKLFAILLAPPLLCSSAFAQTSQPPAPTTEKPDAVLIDALLRHALPPFPIPLRRVRDGFGEQSDSFD